MANLISNMWSRIKIFCLNHDEPLQMEVTRNLSMNSTAFYACTQYFPEKLSEGDVPCPNRLNLDDYQGIVIQFLKEVDEVPPGTDMTNYIFSYKGTRQKIDVRVIRYDDKEIHLGIINRTIIPKF